MPRKKVLYYKMVPRYVRMGPMSENEREYPENYYAGLPVEIEELFILDSEVEDFIFGLGYNKSLLLFYLSMGLSPREIMKAMNLKNMDRFYHIAYDLRKHYRKVKSEL